MIGQECLIKYLYRSQDISWPLWLLQNQLQITSLLPEQKRFDITARKVSHYCKFSPAQTLRACFEALPGNRAVGVDGVTKEQYGANLEENLTDLSARLRNLGYRPQPKRRSCPFRSREVRKGGRWESAVLKTSWSSWR